MRLRAWALAVPLVLASVMLAAGCGNSAPSSTGPAGEAPRGGAPILATSLVTTAGTWAIAVMGGSVTSHNNFWQLFLRPTGSTRWQLVTPPGVPDNGGLVVGSASGQSLITGFRPSQYLTYTPLVATRDGGQAWSPVGPLDAAMANVPDALSVAPQTGQLLALLTTGATKLATAPSYTDWSSLTSQRALAATPSGRRCGLRDLTGVTFTPAGTPLLAGTCRHPGTVALFTGNSGSWQVTGPQLPATLARQPITIVRLTTDANHTVALLKAGNGPAASLLAAWSTGIGIHWTSSPPLPLRSDKLTSASFGAAGQVAVLTENQAHVVTGPGKVWRSLPALPPATATLAPGSPGSFDALAVHRAQLTVWQITPGATAWRTRQIIHVPIQYGSSG